MALGGGRVERQQDSGWYNVKRSLVFATPELGAVLDAAQRAEEYGYHRVWTTETPGRDALIRATAVAMSTKTIGIGTGIAYAFTRAPLAMAAAASDVSRLAGGRFTLGIGTGTQGMRRRWYGITEFDHAATRLAEYADLMREAWKASKTVEYSGAFYQAHYDQLDGSRPQVPVWGSGLNPVMLTVAARHFDGVALHPLASATAYLRGVAVPAIRKGEASGHGAVELALWRVASIDADRQVAFGRAARALALYLATPSYALVAEAAGWADIASRVRAAFVERGPVWADLAAMLPPELVGDLCLVGTPAEARERWVWSLAEYEKIGVTEIVLQAATTGDGERGELDHLNLVLDTFAPNA